MKWAVNQNDKQLYQYRSQTIRDVNFYNEDGEVIFLADTATLRELTRPDGSKKVTITIDARNKE